MKKEKGGYNKSPWMVLQEADSVWKMPCELIPTFFARWLPVYTKYLITSHFLCKCMFVCPV